MSAWRRDGRFPIPSKYCEGVTVGLLAVLDTVILLGNRLESNLHARASLFLERDTQDVKALIKDSAGPPGTQEALEGGRSSEALTAPARVHPPLPRAAPSPPGYRRSERGV